MRKGFALPLIITLIVAVGFLGFIAYIKYFYNNTPFMKTETKVQNGTLSLPSSSSNKTSNAAKLSSPTPQLATDSNGWRIYKSAGDNVQFSFPSDWEFKVTKNSDNPNSLDAEDFTFEKSTGNNEIFRFDLILSMYGIGGGCSGFDSQKDLPLVKPITVLNTSLQELFLGQYDPERTNKITDVYFREKFTGCPNVGGAKIKGLPGLFVGRLWFTNKPQSWPEIPKSLDEFKNNSEVQNAEKVVESLKFIN